MAPVNSVSPLDHCTSMRVISERVAPTARHPVASSYLSVSEGPRGKAFGTSLRSMPREFRCQRKAPPSRTSTAASSTVPMDGKNWRIPPSLQGKERYLSQRKISALKNYHKIYGRLIKPNNVALVEHAGSFMDIPVPDSGIERAHTRDFFDEGIAGDGKCHTSCYAVG